MQSRLQVSAFSASVAEDKVRSPLEAATDSPQAPSSPALQIQKNILILSLVYSWIFLCANLIKQADDPPDVKQLSLPITFALPYLSRYLVGN